MKLTLEEITQDLQALDSRLRVYEQKFGVASTDFYARYQQGLLDDDGFERSMEYTRWASTYALKLERARMAGHQLPPHPGAGHESEN